MKISIVTPVWNDPRVARAIKSIRSQQGVDDVEVIVIDGGSGKETQEVLTSIKEDIDILVSEPDKGIYDAMNKGVRLATGEVIGILNADDRLYDEGVLARVLERFEETDVDLVFGNLVLVNDNDRIVRVWRAGRYAPWKYHFGWMPPHPTVYVRRQVYDDHGLFDLRYRIAADYEFLLRVIKKGCTQPTYLPRYLVRMEAGGASNATAGGIIKANLEVRRAWKDNGLGGGFAVPVLKPMRKIGQFIRRRPAGEKN